MTQRVQVAVPVSGATSLLAESPYGKPSQYFERSVFPDYEGQVLQVRDTNDSSGSSTTQSTSGRRRHRHRSRRERDAIDVRDSAEAMENPDVAAAFAAAAAAAAKADTHGGGNDSSSSNSALLRDGSAGGGEAVPDIACEALANRNRSRHHHHRSSRAAHTENDEAGHPGSGSSHVDSRRSKMRPVSSFEVVESDTNSNTSSAGQMSNGSGEGDLVAGVPLNPARHPYRERRPHRRLVSVEDVVVQGDNDNDADNVVRAVTLQRSLSRISSHGSGSRSSSRSSRSSARRSQVSRSVAASTVNTTTTTATNVNEELLRRKVEEHDPDCICTLCQERRQRDEPDKKVNKLRERLANEGTCTVAFCSVM